MNGQIAIVQTSAEVWNTQDIFRNLFSRGDKGILFQETRKGWSLVELLPTFIAVSNTYQVN